jgi:esterase/lipase superfamily enzyme
MTIAREILRFEEELTFHVSAGGRPLEEADRATNELFVDAFESSLAILKYVSAAAVRHPHKDSLTLYSQALQALWSENDTHQNQVLNFDTYAAPAITTILSFCSNAPDRLRETRHSTIADGVLRRFREELHQRIYKEIESIANRVQLLTGYYAVTEATRAQLPWTALESLASSDERAPSDMTTPILERSLTASKVLDFKLMTRDELQLRIETQDSQDYGYASGEPKDSHSLVAAQKSAMIAHGPSPATQEATPEGSDQVVWYGTNRESRTDKRKGLRFTSDQLPSNLNTYGKCVVHIPQSHRRGSIGKTFFKNVVLPLQRDGKLRVTKILPFPSESEFQSDLENHAATLTLNDGELLVYIHGFNTNFELAARRAAQLAFDLNPQGLTAFYSWPSLGTVYGYVADQDRADASKTQFTAFIGTLLAVKGLKKVSLIVHSMGNRLLSYAVKDLVEASQKAGASIDNLIMAAPDVDRHHLQNLDPNFTELSSHVTMYVSALDQALRASSALRASRRAGYLPPVVVMAGVDTIEASYLNIAALGHGYFAEAAPVLADIGTIISSGLRADERKGLSLRSNQEGSYWSLKSWT